jgi:hypothetical protein
MSWCALIKRIYLAGADTAPDSYRYSQSQTRYRADEYVNPSSLIPDFYLCTFLSFYSLHNAPAITWRARLLFTDKLSCKQKLVLTDHSELICSTSIERIVTGRDTALKQIEQLIQQLDAFPG